MRVEELEKSARDERAHLQGTISALRMELEKNHGK
jgi:hypothetical protein